MATQLDSLGENQFLAVRDVNHPRQDLIIDANNLNNNPIPYKVYAALLSQPSKRNPPTAIILENTIGDIVWTYSSAGVYRATLVGAFPDANKFFTLNYKIMIEAQKYIAVKWLNSNSFEVRTSVVSYSPSIAYTPEDSILDSYPIEIRVYN